jgi:WD40 repeat protein
VLNGGQILVWNALDPSGTVIATLKGHSGAVFATKWSLNGTCLVSVGDDRTVKLWAGPDASCTTSRVQVPLWSSFGHTARVLKCDFIGNDEGLIITGSQDGTARLWRRDNGSCCAVLSGHAGKHVWSLASTCDSQV